MKTKVTIHDVADDAGVSVATVSRVMNHKEKVRSETYRQVYSSMLKTGYITEDLQERNHSSNIILVFLPDIDNPFYTEVLHGVYSAASRNGYQFLICHSISGSSPSLETIKSFCHSTSAVGALFFDTLHPDVRKKLEKTVAVVQCCECVINDETGSYVTVDDYKASKNVVNYLIAKNRKKIALINVAKRFKCAQERQRGYVDALEEAGIEVNPSWSVNVSDINFEPVISVVTQMMSSEIRPDAIFASSDTFGVAAIKAIRACGLSVPQDVSVVGFDNTSISQLSEPSLTTVNQPQFQIGSCACEMLIDKINNPMAAARQLVLNTELILRDSV